MKHFAQLCTLVLAFFCVSQIAQAESVDKAALAKQYNLAEGKKVYEETCSACHASGLLSSPKFCDVAAWKPRMAKGMTTLVKHTIEGFNSMPSKGGLETLSIEQSANAVAYMVDLCLF